MAGDSACETAVYNVESPRDGFVRRKPDLRRAPDQLWPKHTEAGYSRLGSDLPNDPSHRRAMPIYVFAIALRKLPEISIVHDKVVVQLPTAEIRMPDLDAGIQDCDAHASAVALSDCRRGLFRTDPVAYSPLLFDSPRQNVSKCHVAKCLGKGRLRAVPRTETVVAAEFPLER